MYDVPPESKQPGHRPARRIWRSVNVAVLLLGLSQDWVTGCSSSDPLTGFDLAIGGAVGGLLPIAIPLLIVLVYCLVNVAIVLFGRRERGRWLLGLIGVSTIWIAVLVIVIAEGVEDLLIGFWITVAGLLSSLALEVLSLQRRD